MIRDILFRGKRVDDGEWLNIDGDYTFAACSICKMAYEVATEDEAEKGLWDAFMCSYRYCPNCGAKMDENEVENLECCSCGDRKYCPEVEKDENGKWFVRCHKCHRIVWGGTIQEAAATWNNPQDCEANGGGTDV